VIGFIGVLTSRQTRGVVVITERHFERPAIERFVRGWEDAFDRGEYEAMASSYADDAVLSGTGVPTVIGRAAIRQFWRAACDGANNAGIRRTVHPDQHDSCGDLAYLQGTVTLKANDSTTVVWFVTVWKRFGDREWKIVADTSTVVAHLDEGKEASAVGKVRPARASR
jgi:ketosteroid isomerase-like protein